MIHQKISDRWSLVRTTSSLDEWLRANIWEECERTCEDECDWERERENEEKKSHCLSDSRIRNRNKALESNKPETYLELSKSVVVNKKKKKRQKKRRGAREGGGDGGGSDVVEEKEGEKKRYLVENQVDKDVDVL